MTLRQAVFLRLCFPFANERSDYVLKSYGVERFLKELGQGEMPLFLTKSDREHIKSASSEEVDRLLAAAEEAGQKVISFFDNAYPDSLRRIQNSPILLFYQGDITLLEGFCVAVVGSRIISDYGMVSLATLSYELAKSGAVVVSGFALESGMALSERAVTRM